MLFNSFIFFIFLGVILPIFYLLPSKKTKNIFLLLSSYIFYGYWDWRFCFLLLISTIIDFYVGRAIYRQSDVSKRKFLLTISLISNLGILGFFKYFNFFIDSLESIFSRFGGNFDYLHLNILLPVGISFYTFQTLSYTIDIYRRKMKPTNNIIDFGLFVAFFPQLVAGPIERASALLPQLSSKLNPSREQVKQGVVLIITGLFRKVIIGDTAGRYVDHIFGNLELYKSIELLAALVLFSIQIYADFSGYSKIARGTAKLLGVELMINFKQPYLSKNITEFWRRWHISLSFWLRDYLYISLGGNRISIKRTYINLMITMLLGGLWHGASWNFVVWGGLHGLYLAIHKFGARRGSTDKMESNFIRSVLNVSFTYLLVLLSWLFFRSTSWSSTLVFIKKIYFWEPSEYASIFISLTSTYFLATILWDILEYRYKSQTKYLLDIKNFGITAGILIALLLSSFIYMFQADPAPFIYFQF